MKLFRLHSQFRVGLGNGGGGHNIQKDIFLDDDILYITMFAIKVHHIGQQGNRNCETISNVSDHSHHFVRNLS